MSDTDWGRRAVLHARSDAGSEMAFDFDTLADGTLGEMVGKVAAMSSDERARVIIDVPGQGYLTVGEVLALAERPDFPAA
ncbi:hypothetical protein Q4F19_01750 [Sphingomonas sp. BIUV-7]|uniref:Uncharacterized protein n=1 Tax=Sphingomonas natans TaxID=3063330 RepID=A0ABT8Y452_9SPHN|nr:hypothetical protein [Sphingomonas sp. BIUV-7]MDO6413095.1 hypothetical protein [Sphingomonas sp. BIUV-7]